MASTWHSANALPRRGCLHCTDGTHGGHYQCTEARPCQDCIDDALTAAEDIAGYGPGLEEDDGPYERDTDLERPWNHYA